MNARQSTNRRLVWMVLGIGLVSILIGAAAGHVAYLTSRQLHIETVLNYNHLLAQQLSQELSHEWDRSEVPPEIGLARQFLLDRWQQAPADKTNSYVCLISPEGLIAAHSRTPENEGLAVGGVSRVAGSKPLGTVGDLLQAHAGWTGESTTLSGERQLVSYVFNDRLNGLVVVHTPLAACEQDVSKITSPWARTFFITTLVVWPLGLFLVSSVFWRHKRIVEATSLQLDLQFRELEHVYETTPVGLALLDDQLRFLRVNQELARISGVSIREHMGKSIGDILGGMKPGLVNLLGAARDRAEPQRDVVLRTNDVQGGGHRDLLVSCHPLMNRHQSVERIGMVIQDITERRAIEQALAQSESLFRTLVENSNDVIILLDSEGKLIYASPSFERVLGYPVVDWIGESLSGLNHPHDAQKVSEYYAAALRNDGQAFQFSQRIRHRNTQYRIVEIVGTNKLREAGIGALVIIMRDITQRTNTERQLLKNEQRFRSIFTQAAVGVALVETRTGRFLKVNDKYAEIVGTTASELVGRTTQSITFPEDMAMESAAMAASPDLEREPRRLEKRLVHSSGRIVWADITRSSSWRESDFTMVHVEIVVDTSRRRQMEEELQQSEARFRAVCTNAPVGIFLSDQQGRFTFANQRFHQITGVDPESACHTDWSQNIHPDDRVRIQNEWSTSLAEARPYSAIYRFALGKNRIIWVQENSVPMMDGDNDVAGYLSTLVDITDQQDYQQALEISEQRCRTLLDHAPEAIVVFNVDENRFVDFNEKALKLFETDAKQILQSNPVDLSPFRQPGGKDSRTLVAGYLQEALDGGAPAFEWVHWTAKGREFPCEIRLVRLPAKDRRLVRASVADISQRLRAAEATRDQQRQLAHVSRLSVMGEISASISHEINQPLNSITNFSQAALRLLEKDQLDKRQMSEWIREIYEQATRAAEIIRRVSAFVRKGPLDRTVVDLQELLYETIDMVRLYSRRQNTIIEARLSNRRLRFKANRIQIQQVLLNLMLNSVDAVSEIDSELKWLSIAAHVDNEHVVVEFIDNGPGVPPENTKRIFEPFFSTKAEGMGMGLAISRTIIEAHDGQMFCRNPGAQSPFTIIGFRLPEFKTCHVQPKPIPTESVHR